MGVFNSHTAEIQIAQHAVLFLQCKRRIPNLPQQSHLFLAERTLRHLSYESLIQYANTGTHRHFLDCDLNVIQHYPIMLLSATKQSWCWAGLGFDMALQKNESPAVECIMRGFHSRIVESLRFAPIAFQCRNARVDFSSSVSSFRDGNTLIRWTGGDLAKERRSVRWFHGHYGLLCISHSLSLYISFFLREPFSMSNRVGMCVTRSTSRGRSVVCRRAPAVSSWITQVWKELGRDPEDGMCVVCALPPDPNKNCMPSPHSRTKVL